MFEAEKQSKLILVISTLIIEAALIILSVIFFGWQTALIIFLCIWAINIRIHTLIAEVIDEHK